MSNPTSNYSFQMPTPTDLVTDLPADFEIFGQAVDTQMKTNADAATQKSTLTTKGDIYVATGASTPSRLAVGSNNQILTADSSTATGLKWAASSGLTFASGYNYVTTAEDTTSTSFTNLTTTQAVTVTTGTKALVILKAVISNQATYGNTGGTLGVAVSGATTLSASDEYSVGMNVYGPATNFQINSRGTLFLTGLTAGSNTFTMKFKDTNGFTSRFFNRSITVIDMGS